MEEDKNEHGGDSSCIICMDNDSDVELLCGHKALCRDCFNENYVNKEFECPLCKHSHPSDFKPAAPKVPNLALR
jgi:hypothetical protein